MDRGYDRERYGRRFDEDWDRGRDFDRGWGGREGRWEPGYGREGGFHGREGFGGFEGRGGWGGVPPRGYEGGWWGREPYYGAYEGRWQGQREGGFRGRDFEAGFGREEGRGWQGHGGYWGQGGRGNEGGEFGREGFGWQGRGDFGRREPVWSGRYGGDFGPDVGPERGYGGMGETGFRGGQSFAGRGPRNYQRSDERIREEVCDSLSDHPGIDASNVDVSVRGGEITLQGTVDERRQKRLAEDVACAVSGVREVHNQLRVAGGQGGQNTGAQGRQGTAATTTGQQSRERARTTAGTT